MEISTFYMTDITEFIELNDAWISIKEILPTYIFITILLYYFFRYALPFIIDYLLRGRRRREWFERDLIINRKNYYRNHVMKELINYTWEIDMIKLFEGN